MRYWIIVVMALVIDQWSKWIIVSKMQFGESISVIDGFFYITSHRNRGAAFGILQNQQWLFILITSIVIASLAYLLWKQRNERTFSQWGFALVLGGAIGNFMDRIRLSEVVDFFHFQFGSYQYPIFNVADACICIGVVFLFIGVLKEEQVMKGKDA